MSVKVFSLFLVFGCSASLVKQESKLVDKSFTLDSFEQNFNPKNFFSAETDFSHKNLPKFIGPKKESSLLEGELPEDALGPDWISEKKLGSSFLDQVHDDVAFAWPVEGGISSYFGQRGRKFHKGIDIKGSIGSPIRAAAAGKILFARRLKGYGNTVVIDHGAFITLYAHCSKFAAKAGQLVDEGKRVAFVGVSGNARGPHLHFEIRDKNRKPIDPFPLLSRRLAAFFKSSPALASLIKPESLVESLTL